jgi:cytochrome oxidase Cu insertion factor (SCO1/SenC/PrrC family)
MRERWLQLSAVSLGLAFAALLGARLLLTPVKGDVLILVSARQADRLPASAVTLHSSSGWTMLGSFNARAVPTAPQTANLLQASAPVGAYDALRLGGEAIPVQVQVDQKLLAPILVAVAEGKPVKQGAYAGSESVSLGLSQLSGQMKAVPSFNLVDQFGRSVSNASIAGHSVILAAFHTSCRETCPLYTGLFLQLRKQLPPSVMMIEATIDPWQDTPEVLRDYAGRVGASWTFLTGDPAALSAFWKPFDVQLGSGDLHRSTLALIDSHGYVRSYYLGAPDAGASLPPELASQLSPAGMRLAGSHGDGWGQAQVLDTLRAMGGLAQSGAAGQGPAPDFSVTTLDGRRVSLADYRGRPVVINFWASYCAPCRREMPMLQRVARAHPRMTLLLVDERDDRAAASAFVKDLGITSAVPFDSDGKAGDLYQVSGLPTTVFIRAEGSIEGRYVGETNERILSPHLSAIDT